QQNAPVDSDPPARTDNSVPIARYACSAPCTSKLILTSSLTRRPPVSSAAFQVRPHELRLIRPAALAASLVLPHGSFAGEPSSISSAIGWLTPRIVKLPSAL